MKVISSVLGLLLLPTAICINSATALSPQGGNTVHFVGSPVVQTADQHSVTIVWNTNAPSSSRVMYGSDKNNLDRLAEGPYGGPKHEVKIDNLQPGTSYYFQAQSNDASSCGVRSFSTPAAGQPAISAHVAPVVVKCTAAGEASKEARFVGSPEVQTADQHSATIVWDTSAPSSSRVTYGLDKNNLDQLAEAPYGGRKHEVKINNLQPGTTYYFQAESDDAESCGVRSFSTPAVGQPPAAAHVAPVVVKCTAAGEAAKAAHFVGSPVVQSADEHSVTIVWKTSAPSDTRVTYGLDKNNLNQLAQGPYTGRKHEVKINNLKPGTTYYFRAASDEADSCGVRSFSTAAAGQPAITAHVAPVVVKCR